jgi:hypothetical protein
MAPFPLPRRPLAGRAELSIRSSFYQLGGARKRRTRVSARSAFDAVVAG